jgi:Bacterial sugar transferase
LNNPDQYLLKIGIFLRKTSFDELPNLINIINGEMVFVGPRPALYNQNDLMEFRVATGIDKYKHVLNIEGVDLSSGKYKNRLNAFIDNALNGKSNKSMRQLVKSSIEFVENAIDFMNTATHKIDSKQHLAEVCVINTISTVSIINCSL